MNQTKIYFVFFKLAGTATILEKHYGQMSANAGSYFLGKVDFLLSYIPGNVLEKLCCD